MDWKKVGRGRIIVGIFVILVLLALIFFMIYMVLMLPDTGGWFG